MRVASVWNVEVEVEVEFCEELWRREREVWEKGWVILQNELLGSTNI